MICNACQSEKNTQFRDHIFGGGEASFNLLECQDCGLIWTNPIPTPEFLNKFYASNFNYEWYRDHLAEKNQDAKLRVKELKKYLGQSVLDFGGGYGYFASSCRASGLQSEVFDPYAPTENKSLADKKWDSVVLLHSLEHARDPFETVVQIKARLNARGRLIVAVPNSQSQAYKKYGMSSVWAQPPFLHLYHFDRKSLSSLLERAGYRVIDSSVADKWDANYLCDVLLARVFRAVDGFWGKIGNKQVRHIYARLSGLLRRFCFNADRMLFSRNLQDQELTIVAELL